MYSKLNKKQNLRQITESLYIFQKTPHEVEKYAQIMKSDSSDKYVHLYNIEILNLFDPQLQLVKLNLWLNTNKNTC